MPCVSWRNSENLLPLSTPQKKHGQQHFHPLIHVFPCPSLAWTCLRLLLSLIPLFSQGQRVEVLLPHGSAIVIGSWSQLGPLNSITVPANNSKVAGHGTVWKISYNKIAFLPCTGKYEIIRLKACLIRQSWYKWILRIYSIYSRRRILSLFEKEYIPDIASDYIMVLSTAADIWKNRTAEEHKN